MRTASIVSSLKLEVPFLLPLVFLHESYQFLIYLTIGGSPLFFSKIAFNYSCQSCFVSHKTIALFLSLMPNSFHNHVHSIFIESSYHDIKFP